MKILLALLAGTATAFGIILCFFGLATLITIKVQKQPFNLAFTQDYIDDKYCKTDLKIASFKDSIIRYRAKGKDSIANKYTDSANLYINIQNYLK